MHGLKSPVTGNVVVETAVNANTRRSVLLIRVIRAIRGSLSVLDEGVETADYADSADEMRDA
jgi:hypothetical protein